MAKLTDAEKRRHAAYWGRLQAENDDWKAREIAGLAAGMAVASDALRSRREAESRTPSDG